METHATIPYLRETIIFLVAAGVMVPLFHRIKVSPVLGYLVVGGIIGPFGLGLLADDFPALAHVVISDLEGVKALAELGVVFLLFTIGLELSLERLWAMRRLVFGLGSLQILITGSVIGAVAHAFGNPIPTSIVLGACLALSSTAIVMQLLMQGRRLGTPVGRSSFSILLMQDLAVVPILFVVGVLGARDDAGFGTDLALALGKAVLTITVIYMVGRLILRPTLRLVAQSRSPEMFMAVILLTVIGIAAITGAAGLSMALGAFLAGLLLAETEYSHEIEVDIEPFKGLMLGLFFMSVGMGIDWRVVGDEPLWIPLSVIGLFAVKAPIIAGLHLAFGLPRHTAFEAGLLLGQGGEFAFIVVGLAMSLGLMPIETGQFMLIVAGLTMLVTPPVAAIAEKIARRMELTETTTTHQNTLEAADGLEGHVILAGFGRFGQTLADTLQAEAITYVALDTDPASVTRARAEKQPVFYGDASRLDILKRAHIETCAAVVLTMDSPAAAERIVGEIRKQWPLVNIYARARDKAHAERLISAGANTAVQETTEGSLQLAGRVLHGLGGTEDAVRRRLEHQRALEEL
ncbi:MAG: monovalent cation:proton antiporter-2 (CPA2) family protein [Rhodospirillales bacterium]